MSKSGNCLIWFRGRHFSPSMPYREEVSLVQGLPLTPFGNGPGIQAGKERVLYHLQAHARNEPIIAELFCAEGTRARSTIVKKIWQPIDARNLGFIAMTSSTVRTYAHTYVRTYVHPSLYANVNSIMIVCSLHL